MTNIELNLPKELERQLNYLEIISKRPKSFFIEEALKRYLEDLDDLHTAVAVLEEGGETYTTEELLASLK